MTSIKNKSISLLLSILFFASIVCNIPVRVFAADELDGWTFSIHGDVKYEIKVDKEYAYQGNASMKIVNYTPSEPEVYINATYPVEVEEGKTYTVGAYAKSLRSSRIDLCVNWGERYSMTPFGDTFDWTNFEFTYVADKTQTVNLQIIIDGTTSGLWLDNIKFVCNETGKNLVKGGTFEQGGEVSNSVALEENLADLYKSISTADSFSSKDLEKVRGGFKYMSVFEQKGITIDGNDSDWVEYSPLSMPTLPTQYQIYMEDDRKLDATAICKFAQDEENLYMIIEVTDDVFYYEEGGADYYWRGDSIQFAVSDMEESYGTEIGLAHNPKTGMGEVYSGKLTEDAKNSINLHTSVNGNKTIYEVAIPWNVKFETRPSEFMFDVLVNDNDGDGRRYCVELAPGISEGKTNKKFPKFEVIDSERDWYAWIQGEKNGYTGTEYNFEYFLVNNGNAKSFVVTNYNGETETIDVPANSGIRRTFPVLIDKAGDYDIKMKFKQQDKEIDINSHISVKQSAATAEYHQSVIDKNAKHIEEIEKLLKQCADDGISTIYETVNYKIMEMFADFLLEDYNTNHFDNTFYSEKALDKLYNEAKENLNAYLNGEKEPKTVPRYISSKVTVDGPVLYAETEDEGDVERRPVFFVGYGHFDQAKKDIPIFKELGMNTIQFEMGPTSVIIDTPYLENWGFGSRNDPEYKIELDKSVKHSGDSSLKISYNSDLKAHQYLDFYQSVPVTPGKTYTLKGYIKAENAKGVSIAANDWNDRVSLDGNYDWKEFSVSYTAPADKDYTVIRYFCEDKTDAVYLDGLSFCEDGSNENLLRNSDFEKESTDDVEVDPYSGALSEVIKTLKLAEKHDISVDLLLSPHYFPNAYIDKHDIRHKNDGWMFLNYNVNSEPAKKLISTYLNVVVPKVKNCKAVSSICISNEPAFRVDYCGDYYLADWHEYLKGVYNNDIQALNNAYGTNHLSFEEINFVTSNIVKKYDYKKFSDKIFASWHEWMVSIIKEIAPDIPLHSKIMNYITETHSHGLYNGTGYEEYYNLFEVNGCDGHSYPDSTRGHLEKQMWYDYMRSLKNVPVYNTEDHIIQNHSKNYGELVPAYISRDLYMGAIHGRGKSDIWVWERTYEETSDFEDSILFRPDTIAEISKATLDLNRNSYEIAALVNEESEIGILYPDPSLMMDITTPYLSYHVYTACLYNGKKPVFITQTQLDKINDCKMLIVPNSTFVTPETVTYIENYIKSGGKVVIIGNESLKKNEKRGYNNTESINYIYNNSCIIEYEGDEDSVNNMTETELYAKLRDLFKQYNLYYVSVRDEETGKPVDYVEYNVGVYDGKVIVNLVNYEAEKKVNIYLGDTIAENIYDLRNATKIDNGIVLEPHIPVTLEIEVSNTFIDTYGHWAEKDINDLYHKGIVSGISESRFAPQKTLTRAEFLALLMRCIGISETDSLKVTPDVKESDWYATAVSTAINLGIINADKDFRPNDHILREEMCELLVSCYEHQKEEINIKNDVSFSDSSKISNITAVQKAVSSELMYGRDRGEFAPQDTATRAEAAAVILRYIER